MNYILKCEKFIYVNSPIQSIELILTGTYPYIDMFSETN